MENQEIQENQKKEKKESGIRKAYKFRLYPNDEQQNYFRQLFGCCRLVYNHFLSVRIEAYEAHKEDDSVRIPSHYDMSPMLTEFKKKTVGENGEHFLYDVDATALVYELKHLDMAFKNFFRRVKQQKPGQAFGFPKFKSRYDRQSATIAFKKPENITEKRIKFAKIGWVNAAVYREIEGTLVNATISCDAAGRWWVSFGCKKVPCKPLPPNDNAVGITMGIDPWVVTSEGEEFENPHISKQFEKKLAREQRKLSRRQGPKKGEKPSKRYLKQKKKVAKLHAKMADKRKTETNKVTAQLVRENGTIITRDMASQEMVKSKKGNHKKLNRSIMDASFAEINRQLEYKSEWAGREFVKLPKESPTAQTCSECGHVEKSVATKSSSKWTCPACGAVHDRKANGAKNVLKMGLDILGERDEEKPL